MNLHNKYIFFQTLYFLVQKELSVRYKGSFLGYLWAILNPLAFALVYFIAFSLVLRFDIENYPIILITALFPWVWISTSLVQGSLSFRSNSNLIKKIHFNYILLPLSNILHDSIHFILSVPIIFLFLMLNNFDFYFSWIWQIPLMVLVQVCFLLPLVLVLSILNVFLRDVEHMINVILSLLFFLTPIVYPISLVPDEYLSIYNINPLIIIIENWRSIFFNGIIDYLDIFILTLISIIVTFFARFFFIRYRMKFAEYL